MSSKINILREIQHKKNGGLLMSDKIGDTIAKVIKNNKTKFINQSIKSNVEALKIDNQQYMIEPYIPLSLERIIAILSGSSGSGKSLLSSILCQQYKKHFPKNKVYFVSQINYKDDINLKGLNLIQLPTDEMDKYIIEDYKNSLILFDDNDFNPDLKKIMSFLNKVVELGRKFGTSAFFSTHIHSRLNISPIYKEANLYITFNDSLINNRMLENNLKIDKSIIEELKKQNHAFICFNNVFKTIITDSIIFKY